jgi:GTP cyclohydrolase I
LKRTYVLEYTRQTHVVQILELVMPYFEECVDEETTTKAKEVLDVARDNVERMAAESRTDVSPNRALVESIWGPDRFDWDSEHFERTPERFVTMLRELTDQKEFNFTMFDAGNIDEMVVIKNIDFVALCAHHIVPFMGKCHIGYIPLKHMAGLSKFARLVKYHAANLTVQEQLTQTICDDLGERLNPAGVMVVMEAEHLCMTIRGVQSPGTTTITSAVTGVFADHTRQARAEFLNLIKES